MAEDSCVVWEAQQKVLSWKEALELQMNVTHLLYRSSGSTVVSYYCLPYSSIGIASIHKILCRYCRLAVLAEAYQLFFHIHVSTLHHDENHIIMVDT